MKITHHQVGQNLNISDAKESNKSSEVGKALNQSKRDAVANQAQTANRTEHPSVKWSEQAQLAHKAAEVAKNSEDVRMDKVNQFKELIAKGQYQVDTEALAEKILNEHLEF